MKITDIALENLGPYIGSNHFSFTVDDSSKKVVLIGGKNGAGKTTLFHSIRIGLYGCRAYGFASDNAKYMEIISQMINSQAKLERTGRASVQISILMDDGKADDTYTFERSWKLSTKNLREDLTVYRNGSVLNEVDKSDFQSYLLQLIPPDMFRFYFFDGESIGDFIFNGVNNTDFKHAFLKLCGLDTMEIIYDNFLRISHMRKKDAEGAFDDYQAALNLQGTCSMAISEAQEEKSRIQNELVLIEEELQKLEQNFLARGGISKQEYQAMQTQIHKEEAKRDVMRKWLKDTANDVLPFIVLRNQLVNLKRQIEDEERAQTALAFQDGLQDPEIRGKLIQKFQSLGINFSSDLSDAVVSVLLESVCGNAREGILHLSKREQLDLLAKINNLLAFDTSRVRSATESIEASLKRVKQIRKKMDKSDESGSEAYFVRKDSLLNRKSDYLKRQLDIERKMDALNLERNEIDAQVKKTRKKYEEFLKAKSVSDITAKALLAFGDLQSRLYHKYIADVEVGFGDCFRKLINKSDLIDGIKIDEQLQVYPYQYRTFQRSEIDRMIKQSGVNDVIAQLGSIAYEAFLEPANRNAEEVTLPVEVKQQLSAGEKQIFIMALYQALSKLNKVSVPYIIDTPFARIDTEHRQNILKNFFMNLKGQVIILSTDEEIVGPYQEFIDNAVSDYYLLEHSTSNGTNILGGQYFGGPENGK